MAETVVSIAERHLAECIDVHRRSFPSFFLSFLGPGFLREFYRSFLDDPVGMGFVAEEDAGLVLGVVVGPQNPEGYFRRLLKRRWWAFCASSAWALVKKPTIAPRLFRAVFYRGEAPPGPPRALLSSVAVAPEAQGKGIGAALVRRWVEEARARGAAGCYLTTDADNNEAVNRFYQKLGWTVESTYATPEGRRMNRYVLDFSPPRPQDTKTHEETA